MFFRQVLRNSVDREIGIPPVANYRFSSAAQGEIFVYVLTSSTSTRARALIAPVSWGTSNLRMLAMQQLLMYVWEKLANVGHWYFGYANTLLFLDVYNFRIVFNYSFVEKMIELSAVWYTADHSYIVVIIAIWQVRR